MRTFVLSCMVLALAIPARATVLIPADLGELSRDAMAIARGRVAALDAQWTEDRGTIETIVTLEVESYLKGSLGSTLRSGFLGVSLDGSGASLSARRNSRSISASSCSSARAVRACRTCSG